MIKPFVSEVTPFSGETIPLCLLVAVRDRPSVYGFCMSWFVFLLGAIGRVSSALNLTLLSLEVSKGVSGLQGATLHLSQALSSQRMDGWLSLYWNHL